MKKIVLSLTVIAVVSIAVVGATRAFFSDTETSTGNTFTAGTLDLTVTSTGTAEGASCTFASQEGDAIIACNDVKPGDSGESTVKFNLQSNPAWACVYVNNVTDSDNSCTEPELDAEEDCTPTGDGELDNNLLLTVWVDDGDGQGVACNNEKDGSEEVLVENAPLSQFVTSGGTFALPVADNSGSSMMDEPLQPGDHCVGIAWSVPVSTGNNVQSDSLGGDLEFYVEQSRNNDTFTCSQQ